MTDISTLGKRWQSLRDSDDKAEQAQVLKSFSDLVQQGTPATQVLTHLGQPDDMKPTLGAAGAVPTMPGPAVPEPLGAEPASMYFIYYANRENKSAYAAFKVDAASEKVQSAEWHQ